MEQILTDNKLTFKMLEENIYSFVCGLACEMTRLVLEAYDDEIAEGRDKKQYRDKGKRVTCIKTVYGDVVYSRRVYRTQLEDGQTGHVFLLDEEMGMDTIGLISTNLAEKIAFAATEAPYRKAAELVSSMTGGHISHAGVWNLIQRLGERISKEEDLRVRKMDAGMSEGRKTVDILFEEMDGIWLRMQDSQHRKAPGKEMKVFTMYEGWDTQKESEGRSTLVGRKALAGMEDAETFHRKREACIEQEYDADGIGQRVLNGDGGPWIRETYDEAIFQLDPYHVHKAILEGIRDKKARETANGLYMDERPEELLAYILTYADSIESDGPDDKQSKNARELYTYLKNNQEGLLTWKTQIEAQTGRVPEAPVGRIYKNMGVQENQNCTDITLRMKHRRMRWSVNGANNMGKSLYRKANGELADTVGRFTDGLVFEPAFEVLAPVLSAAQAPKKDGKGNPYVDRISCHIPLLDSMRTAARKAFTNYLMGVAG